jgi:uncharacterized membrane protein YhdT
MKRSKDKNIQIVVEVIYWFVLISLIYPIGYLFHEYVYEGLQGKNGLFPMLSCIALMIVMIAKKALAKKLKLKTPPYLEIASYLFFFLAIPLGELLDFYNIVPFWDSILHFVSPFIVCSLAGIIYTLLAKNDKENTPLKFTFIGIFSVASAIIWELWEFICDEFGSNAQRTITADGTPLFGHEAIVDTMKDILMAICGTAIYMIAIIVINIIQKRKINKTLTIRKQNGNNQIIECKDKGVK